MNFIPNERVVQIPIGMVINENWIERFQKIIEPAVEAADKGFTEDLIMPKEHLSRNEK